MILDTNTNVNPAGATRTDLADHNARVRRLANSYAKKYRPVVLTLGYAEALTDQHYPNGRLKCPAGASMWGIDAIAANTARYTDNGKPLSRRRVLELMAEMKSDKAGALFIKDRYSDETGRQRSSYRFLSHDVAVNREGWSIPHDWDAPLTDSDKAITEFPHPSMSSEDTCNQSVTGFPHPSSHPSPHPSSHPVLSFDLPLTSLELSPDGQDQGQGDSPDSPGTPGELEGTSLATSSGLPSSASLASPAGAWAPKGMRFYTDEPSDIPSVLVYGSTRNSQVFKEKRSGTRPVYVSVNDYAELFG